ncbi:hypothetical protein AALF16_25950 [Bacillus cereus]|uniref:hypothetical protein n=1 Tax=Bacillus cereus TaxID=1396 RepID=UPI00356CEC69
MKIKVKHLKATIEKKQKQYFAKVLEENKRALELEKQINESRLQVAATIQS